MTGNLDYRVTMAFSPATIENDTTDADHDIKVNSRTVLADDTTTIMTSSGVLIKQLDSAWAVGNNAGGLDTGSIAADTWYSVWLIAKADKIQDVLFSTSATSPTMPTDYIYKRRVGWILTDSSSNILPFRQEGDRFYWLSPILDFNSLPSSSQDVTVSAPVNTLGHFALSVTSTSSSIPRISIQPTFVSNLWPPSVGVKRFEGTGIDAGHIHVYVDGSNQVNLRRPEGGNQFFLSTVGWLDRRGRDD